jgi:hypothetical protein
MSEVSHTKEAEKNTKKLFFLFLLSTTSSVLSPLENSIYFCRDRFLPKKNVMEKNWKMLKGADDNIVSITRKYQLH